MLRLATLLLFVPAVIWADDPFAGTWKLNASKSKYDKGSPPKEQIVTITNSGDSQLNSVTITPASGNPVSYRYTVPVKGGTGEVSLQRDASGSQGSFDAVTGKRPNENTRDLRFTLNGKDVRTVHSVVSKDGKTMRVTVKGMDALGNPVDAVMVLEKQ
jgi:hypothetical protein